MSNIFGKIKKNNKSLEIKESKRNVKIINKINKRNQTLRDGILIKLIIISNIMTWAKTPIKYKNNESDSGEVYITPVDEDEEREKRIRKRKG